MKRKWINRTLLGILMTGIVSWWAYFVCTAPTANTNATYYPNGLSSYNPDNSSATPGECSFGGTYVSGTLSVTGAATAGSTLGVTGVLTPTGGITFVAAGPIKFPTLTTVSLTSPTVTFSASGKTFISLNSNGNQTGIYPTAGTINQILYIESGAGSNTMRFDDGTSMTVGGNITLTEAQGDVLCLKCTSADGDDWQRVFSSDN